MHDEVRCYLAELAKQGYEYVADVGAYNINGSVKEYFPAATGFDVVPGLGVDRVLDGNEFPDEFRGKFDLVVSVNTAGSADLSYWIRLLSWLCEPGGRVFVNGCSQGCLARHRSSLDTVLLGGRSDKYRFSEGEFLSLILPFFEVTASVENLPPQHPEIFVWGIKR